MSKLQEKLSALKREHPALQKIKKTFSMFVDHFFYPDPDWIRIQWGSWIRIWVRALDAAKWRPSWKTKEET